MNYIHVSQQEFRKRSRSSNRILSSMNALASAVMRETIRRSVFLATTLLIAGLGSAGGADQKYPPYPDVWDWMAPKGMENIGLRVKKLEDGDLQIVYEDRRQLRDNQRPVSSTRFFGDRKTHSQVLPTANSLIAAQQTYKAEMKDGSVVQGSMGPGLRSNRCYDRLSGNISVRSAKGDISVKSLLYVFDKPRTWRVSAACKGMDGPDVFSYQIESIFAQIIPLEDGTFLAVDGEHGLVMRFDSEFKTKSALIGRRVFVVDTKELEEFWTSSFRDDELDKLQRALHQKLVPTK